MVFGVGALFCVRVCVFVCVHYGRKSPGRVQVINPLVYILKKIYKKSIQLSNQERGICGRKEKGKRRGGKRRRDLGQARKDFFELTTYHVFSRR